MTTPLIDRLRLLGLHATADTYDDLCAEAATKRWSPAQILERILAREESTRYQRSMERRLIRSRLGLFKSLADFDWNWPKKIDRSLVESAARGDFIEAHRNVVLVAAQGLGKTMIAQNIAHAAVSKGHTVIFTTAAQLLMDLCAQESTRALERRLRYYSKVSLLVIDEMGYLAFDNRNADMLFQVVSRRYEKKSLVLTTNLAFKDWPTVFPNASCATALIDRVIHHADVITIEGSSYRLREAEKSTTERRAATLKDTRAKK
jgi:DNA replication protein DnaC